MTDTPLIELGAVLIVLALLARIASRVGIPAIPLYLLAGLTVGEGGIVPLGTTSDFARTGAEIGVVLLLFTLGLEYTAEDLFSTMRTSLPAGVLNFALSFGPGLAAGFLLGWGTIPALFLGGITFVTSTSVVAKIVNDLGWTGNREIPLVLSISITEDLTMTLYLPLLTALVVGGVSLAGLGTALAAIAGVVVILFLALRFEEQISRILFTRNEEALLLSILGIVILAAGVAEAGSVSAAVGALLAGIVLSGPAAQGARDLLPPLRNLFAAFFFFFVGLEVDPSSIAAALAPAVVLAVVGIAGKVVVGWWAARGAGMGPRARARASALLIPRGEFSIALAGISVSAGIEPRVASLAVAYVFILAVAAPIAARLAVPLADRLSGRGREPSGPTHVGGPR
ncbi:MAG TPA: cation:proton antiporter [Actinomycetota bacterium]|nr:cation:proton antiporter [Actinomycetota bacterium]